MSAVRRRIPNDIPAFGLLRGVGIDARGLGERKTVSRPSPYGARSTRIEQSRAHNDCIEDSHKCWISPAG